jgi:hypothetical protein
MKTQLLSKQNPRRSIWVAGEKMARTEAEAKLRINLEKPAIWRVINPNAKGPLGYPVSYELRYEANSVSLLSPMIFRKSELVLRTIICGSRRTTQTSVTLAGHTLTKARAATGCRNGRARIG